MDVTDQNETLRNVGRRTATGRLFRRCWIPACLSEEVAEHDGPLISVRLLGEDLLAFRDSLGQVGLVSAYCAHRRAPLFDAVNAEGGIRCNFHGWKFDTEGNCTDMPSAPPGSDLNLRVAIKAYPTYEAGGLVWTYMGPTRLIPEIPNHEWMGASRAIFKITKAESQHSLLETIENTIRATRSLPKCADGKASIADQVCPPCPMRQNQVNNFAVPAAVTHESHGQQRVFVDYYVLPNQLLRASRIDAAGTSRRSLMSTAQIWVPRDNGSTSCYSIEWKQDDYEPVDDQNSFNNQGKYPNKQMVTETPMVDIKVSHENTARTRNMSTNESSLDIAAQLKALLLETVLDPNAF